MPSGTSFLRRLLHELLGDRDHWQTRAEQAERERDELLTLAANIETIADDEDVLGELWISGQLTRIAASMMVAAVRLHHNVQTGISCEVSVEGRKLDVIAQWQDAPAVTNWVAFASDIMKAKSEADRERDQARDLAERWRDEASIQSADPLPWEPHQPMESGS